MILSQVIAGGKAMWDTYLAKTLPLGLAAFDFVRLPFIEKSVQDVFKFMRKDIQRPS